MRIFLLGNSQSTPAGIEPEQALSTQLRDALVPEHEFHLLAVSGWSIIDFAAHLHNVTLVRPDVVVLQVGIVECSRRILSEREKRLIARIPRSRVITKWLHDRRQRVIRARHRLGIDTRLFTVAEFERSVADVVEELEAGGARVIVLEVPPFGAAYEEQWFPLINEDAELFNSVLRQHGSVPLLTHRDPLDDLYQSGTVHFTPAGHRLAAARILAALEPLR